MVAKYKGLITSILIFVCICVPLSSAIIAPETVLNNSNELLAANIPITYGDANFRQRILERTNGEREPVGLVLSGGSARAFAHIGVLKYLEEQGIVPDFIISNSMGSIVALLYGAGLSPEQIITVCSSINMGQLFDLTLPLGGGFLDTSRFSALVENFLGEGLRLEDLPIPVMVVSEDLATKRQSLIAEGDFISILEASFVLPVYFSPVEYNGHLLIDGGMTNLVPLKVAYDYSHTVVVSTTFYEGIGINLRNSVSIVNVAFDIGKRRQGVVELLSYPDTLWIRCDVEGFSFMDFSAIGEIVVKGYDSAAAHKDELARLDARGAGQATRTVRADFSAREKSVIHNYSLFERVNQSRFSHQLFPGITSYQYDGDPWILRDDNVLGLSYDLRWKLIDFSIDAGMGWKSTVPMDAYPAMMTSLRAHLLPFMMATVDLGFFWDSTWLPSYYSRVGLDMRHAMFSERLEISLAGSLENQLSSKFSLSGMLLTAGTNVKWTNTHGYPFAISVGTDWQMAGTYDRSFINVKMRSLFPLPYDLFIEGSFNGRFALDGKGEVPFYMADQFRTTDPVLSTQGSLSPAGALNPANYLISSRLQFSWQPKSFKPTFGEMMILKDSKVGVYTDLLYNSVGQVWPSVSVGLELSTELALLGLKGTTLSGFVGYDQRVNNIVWGFVFRT